MNEQRADERRSSIPSLCYPERRTGFDRRRNQVICELLRDNGLILALLILALNALNLADLYLTTSAFELGAIEGNPLMSLAFDASWETAAIFKIGVMISVTVAIWTFRSYRRVLQFALAAGVTYAALIVYHLVGRSMIS